MKAKIFVTSAIVLTMLTSCGSHCNINKWRCRRYVQTEKPVEKPTPVKRNA